MAGRSAAPERRWRAMGSEAHLVVIGRDHLLDEGMAEVDRLERLWSRFLADSDVSRMNAGAGTPVAVADDTLLLVERAVAGWTVSGGCFDPTVLGDLVRAGYDRSFDEVTGAPGVSLLGIGAADIEVGDGTVLLPSGTGFDPGGIGKGLAADLVAERLLDLGAEGACVNLGGDLRVVGAGPDGGTWTVAIEHPWAVEPLALVGLADGAVATSTTLTRRWEGGHHLIDPALGLPSDTDLRLASVVAGEAWLAEVLAKAILLRGSASPFDLTDGGLAEALVVDVTGTIMSSPGLTAYLGEAPPPQLLTAPCAPG